MGFIQVFLVVANMYFIANKVILGIIILAFLINYIWSHNVRKIAFGKELDRIIYSIGATSGAISGYYSAVKVVKLLGI